MTAPTEAAGVAGALAVLRGALYFCGDSRSQDEMTDLAERALTAIQSKLEAADNLRNSVALGRVGNPGCFVFDSSETAELNAALAAYDKAGGK